MSTEQSQHKHRHKWLFVLTNKNTQSAGWWLKLTSQAELAEYLAATDDRYAKAFENFLQDSFYQLDRVGHGPHIREAGLTLTAYLHGLNHDQSFLESLMGIQLDNAVSMSEALARHGAVYVNVNGGWNFGRDGKPYGNYDGDFVYRDDLVWPHLSRFDVRVSKFPGGKHYYGHIGQVQIKKDGRTRFDTITELMAVAEAYFQDD